MQAVVDTRARKSLGKVELLSGAAALAIATCPANAQAPTGDQQTATASELAQAEQLNCQVPQGGALPAGCEVASNEATATSGTIVVTGSRIRRPNLESPLPVTSVGGEEFFETGNVSIGDKLAELPSIASTVTQANSTRFLGGAGLNLLDLRGLGPVRTLVLVNGRRHVGGDILVTGVVPDVNTIPTDLIERVDVVTGGNSAVYGSDAIAGVVNFILKDDYKGFMVRGQAGRSSYGDASSYFISGLAGADFADGRGNVALNVEYARRDQAFGDHRKWFRRRLVQVDSDPAGTPDGSDGSPDWVLDPNFRHASFSTTGTIRFATNQCGLDPKGTPYLCPFIFQPDGTLVAQTGTRMGLGPNGAFVGGNGEGFFDKHQVQVMPQLDRYNVNIVAHFEVLPWFAPFVEGTFSRTESVGSGANGPAFMAGASGGIFFDPYQFLGGYNRELISINNPFLTPQARQLIIDQRTLAGLTTNASTRVNVQESLLGLGNRTEEARRDTFRIVGGLRGDLGDNWNYEVSVNHGQLREKTKVLGNLDVQRMLLALDAVDEGIFNGGPANGHIVCRSQLDDNAAFGYNPWIYGTLFPGGPVPGDPNGAARLANDVAQCVPINVLGGQITDAMKDYVLLDTVTKGKSSQFDALAFISGDSSKWFELPGGPIGIVLGAEYRADNLEYREDEQVQLGYTFYNAIPSFTAPTSKVSEAFGEIRVPIFKDRPFLRELELSAAARISDYNLGKTGAVWAYNGNVIWSPVEGVRLRGNFARSVRAPNQVELFTPFGQNYALVTDPCDKDAIGAGSSNRAANCAAAGIPVGQAIVYGSSLGYLTGGNVNLEAETSDSITVGGVFTPRALPGFSFSADYYSVKVKNVIAGFSAQQVLNACYDLPSLSNPYCDLFQRSGASGANAQVPYGVVTNSLQVTPLNFAKMKARGVDVEVGYRHQIANLGRIDTRLNWTHVLELTQWIDPTDPTFGDRLLSELGSPKDAFTWNTAFQHGPFTVGYKMRYIGKQIVSVSGLSTYEDFFPFEGRPPNNADSVANPWYSSRFYHDVRVGADINKRFNLYAGVDNLTNTKPPFNASGIGGGSGIYDVVGRFFYVGASAKF